MSRVSSRSVPVAAGEAGQVPGLPGRVRRTPWGSCYEIAFTPAELSRPEVFRPQQALADRKAGLPLRVRQRDELFRLQQALPRRVLFVDLETCGFAGSPVFLVGLVYIGREVVGRQYLARDWSEEPAILYQFWKHLRRRPVLATFNGKSFDWPMLVARTIYHQPQDYAQWQGQLQAHCDLLHHARRLWKTRLPNCRLKTLERYICGYQRAADDIPGWAIPDAYRRFVTEGETEDLVRIVYHNQMDLLTLVELTSRVLECSGLSFFGR